MELYDCNIQTLFFQLRKEREQRLMLKRGGSTVTDSNGKITNGNTNPKGMHLSMEYMSCVFKMLLISS